MTRLKHKPEKNALPQSRRFARAASILLQILIANIVFAIFCVNSLAAQEATEEEEILKQLTLFAEVVAQVQKEHLDYPDSKETFYAAIRGMLATLDPYSEFLDEEAYKRLQTSTRGTFGGLGMYIGIRRKRLTVISPIEDTPAYRAGILAGDQIIEIEGTSTTGISIGFAVQQLRGEPGTPVTITVIREGEEEALNFTIVRDIITIQTVKHRILGDEVGYIRITSFSETTDADVDKAFADFEGHNLRGVVLDLRDNPGGLLSSAVDVASYFVKNGLLIVYTQGRDKSKKDERFAREKQTHKRYPLVVLVNKGSASGSEIVAGAIKDNKSGLIMGTRTFGKASVQKIFPVGREIGLDVAVKLTVAHYYTPGGIDIHTLGIEPHITYPSLSPSEVKVLWKLRRSNALKEFIEKSGDDILERLKAARTTLSRDARAQTQLIGSSEEKERQKQLVRQYQTFVEKLEEDQIVLSDDLIQFAIAAETTNNDKDEYEFDPQIQAAINYLQAYEVFLSGSEPADAE